MSQHPELSPVISEERSGFTSIFGSIRDAIKGDPHRDFTKERVGRAIALLAIPMVLEMAMESLFAVVDMFWVAHVSADAVATVGLTEAVLTLLFSVAMGLSVATISLAIIMGTVLLLLLIYLIAFVCVPATVFFPAYALYFFASRYPTLDVLLNPAPAPLPPVPQSPSPFEAPPLLPSVDPIG